MQPATSATQKADRPSLRDRFAFSIKRQMSDEIGLADDASDRPVLFADDNKPNMWTGRSNGCIPQCRVSCDHSKARLSDRREVDRHIGRGRVEVGREPVIQAPELQASFESCAMNSPTTNGLPSSRCCRTSRAACHGSTTGVSSMASFGY